MIVIFDLDGTLVDTYPIIRKTLIEVFSKFLPNFKYDEDYLKSFFGPTLQDSFYKITNNQKETDFLISEYRKINRVYYETELTLYPKVKESLEKLSKKYKLAILSNRIQEMVDVGLKITDIEKYFDVVIGLDNMPKPKPHPGGIIKILEKYNEKKAVFIGDALSDVETAQNAGIIGIGTTWALTSREEFAEINTDYIVDDYDELVKVLEEINV